MSGVVESLPAAATIFAALITGFGAAGAKQRWDARNERLKWARESEARARRERLEAFGAYLTARPNRASVGQRMLTVGGGQSADLDSMLSAARLEAAKLLILLDDERDRTVVADDLEAVHQWLRDISRRLAELHLLPDVVTADAVLDLARRLSARRSDEIMR
jgi:hypothetical protein